MLDTGIFHDVIVMRRGHPLVQQWINTAPVWEIVVGDTTTLGGMQTQCNRSEGERHHSELTSAYFECKTLL